MLVICLYESNAVDTNTNNTVTIKDNAEDIELKEGEDATIKCDVVLEEEMERYLTVKWFHEEIELVDLPRQQPVFGGQGGEFTEDLADTFEGSALCGEDENCSENKVLLPDNSLKISGMKHDDAGDYKCKAFITKDGASEEKAFSQVTTIYLPSPFPWWIIVVVVIIVILIVVAVLFYLKYRKGWNIKGYYDVNDIENNGDKSDKSDIFYKAETVASQGKVTYNQQESTLMEEPV